MATVAVSARGRSFPEEVDGVLFGVCDELQLVASRYKQAEDRYKTVTELLEQEGSPFTRYAPKIYPQGSMRLGTTVQPIDGPHDLDFVLELSLDYRLADPMNLIRSLYEFLKEHGVYKEMASLKNRCVRITYANEFHMDILPACQDRVLGQGCIRVPDRQAKSWKASNPIGFANWFERRAQLGQKRFFKRAAPLPSQETTAEKWTLQLIVQLLKRWRDIHYGKSDDAPISIVLTTLAGHYYRGEDSTAEALSQVLARLAEDIKESERLGRRLVVLNPSNSDEDVSERWGERAGAQAYAEFKAGINDLSSRWERLRNGSSATYAELEALFGEPVKQTRIKQAQALQESRKAGRLGVDSRGRIASASVAATPLRPSTFFGD